MNPTNENGQSLPGKSIGNVTNNMLSTVTNPSRFRHHEVGPCTPVHNPRTPPWHRPPPMNTVLEGWQNSLPKLYKYPTNQLEVVFHRGGKQSEESSVAVGNQIPRKSSMTQKGNVNSTSSVNIIPRPPNWNPADLTSDEIMLNKRYTRTPSRMYRPSLDLKSLVNGQSMGFRMGADSSLHHEESEHFDNEKPSTDEPFSTKPSVSLGTDISSVSCVSCEELKVEVDKLKKDLAFVEKESSNLTKSFDVVLAENAKLLKDKARMEDLLRQVKVETDKNCKALNDLTLVQNMLVISTAKLGLDCTDSLLTEEDIDRFIVKAKSNSFMSPEASTPLVTPMTGRICTPPVLTPIETIQLESPEFQLDQSAKQIRGDFQKIRLRPSSQFMLPSRDKSLFFNDVGIRPSPNATRDDVQADEGIEILKPFNGEPETPRPTKSDTPGVLNPEADAIPSNIPETPRGASCHTKSRPRVLNESFTREKQL